MNYRYQFKWKRVGQLFWRRAKVIGHRFEKDQDKMLIYREDGSIREIALWSKCEIDLGVDWVLATKKSMEAQAGQAVNLEVDV